MRKIVSSIDIGNNCVKLVVGEFIESRLHILSATKIDSGSLTDGQEVVKTIAAIKKAVAETSVTLGLEIKKVVLGVDTTDAKLIKTASAIKIKNEDFIINGNDVTTVMQKSAEGKIPEGYVLVGIIPVEFTIDDDKVALDPKGLTSQNLGIKSIIVTSPKDYISNLLSIIEQSGLKVIDVVPTCLGDYFSFRSKTTESTVGAIINLGNEISTVSIFNKGILTNTKTYPIGANNVISDISFVNKISESDARAVYKDIVLASSRLANSNEYSIVTNTDGKQIKLNQYDVSEIAASRIEEILNLAKKQINVLTKKEISYIIVSGSLTELRNFSLALESTFGKNVFLGKMNLIGARDNSYSSAVGIIRYFDSKLKLRGKEFTIFNDSELEEMNNGGKRANVNNDSLLGKVFGYFFDN